MSKDFCQRHGNVYRLYLSSLFNLYLSEVTGREFKYNQEKEPFTYTQSTFTKSHSSLLLLWTNPAVLTENLWRLLI